MLKLEIKTHGKDFLMEKVTWKFTDEIIISKKCITFNAVVQIQPCLWYTETKNGGE